MSHEGGVSARFRAWIERNAAEIENTISRFLNEGEECACWAFGYTAAAPEILRWLPGLSLIHVMGRHYYILALTQERVLRIETQTFSSKTVKEVSSLALADVGSVCAEHSPWFSSLVIEDTLGERTAYRRLQRDVAGAFEAKFNAIKS